MTPLLGLTVSMLSGLAGALVGCVHFGSLRWLCGRLAVPGAVVWGRLVMLHLLRWAVLIGALYIAARFGPLALAAHAAGLLLARSLWLRHAALGTP